MCSMPDVPLHTTKPSTATNMLPSASVLAICPRASLVEQVMRSCSDDLLVVPFLDASPLSQGFMAALGRLLPAAQMPPPMGSPLQVWAGTGTLHPDWRLLAADAPDSVWGELCMLRILVGSDAVVSESFGEPFSELVTLRARYS